MIERRQAPSAEPRTLRGPFLGLDSSTPHGSVAVGTSAGVLAETTVSVQASHSSTLLSAIEGTVRSAGLEPADLTGIVVGAGPGSFTGVRIAAATGKGIAAGLGVPMYAYSSLLAAAAPAAAAAGMVCAIFDARGRDVFTAAYEFAGGYEVIIPPSVMKVDELIIRVRDLGSGVAVGDGAIRHGEEIEDGCALRVAPPHFGFPRAASLVWLATTESEDRLTSVGPDWEPTYLRASGAERIAAARAVGSDGP